MQKIETLSGKESLLTGTKLIIFDWSGTISDDRQPCYLANKMILVGLEKVSFEQWLKMTEQAYLLREFLDSVGWKSSVEEFRYWNEAAYDMQTQQGNQAQIHTEMKDVLEQLKKMGAPLVVVSNHPTNQLTAEAVRYGVIGVFQNIYSGVTDDKKSALTQVCQEMGISPSDAVYIADTVGDIRMAKNAGLKTIAVDWGWHSREALLKECPHHLIDKPMDLFK